MLGNLICSIFYRPCIWFLFKNIYTLFRLAEKKTDDILDNPNKADGKQSQEEVDETVTKRKFVFVLYTILSI